MKKVYIVTAVFVVVAAGVVFYQYGSNKQVANAPAEESSLGTPSGAAQPSNAASPAPAAPAEQLATQVSAKSVTITYSDSGFSPSNITINKGDTVVFENKSSSSFWPASAMHPAHTVYDGTSLKEHCASPTSDTFDACGGVAVGQSWSFTFNKVGSWNYHDHLSASFYGTIVVK